MESYEVELVWNQQQSFGIDSMHNTYIALYVKAPSRCVSNLLQGKKAVIEISFPESTDSN